ncbi:hypothetical protein CPB86DRAFT_780727 [Serendipita vermifera]|nr:hypothetical protein CPB86DRAFT_780727 [Serendipita vermifera]
MSRIPDGTPPFYMFITPPSGTPRNISIPESAWDGSKGSFFTTLNLTAGQSFVLTMSDATGFGTGGNSDLLTVGGASNAQCNTTNPGTSFSFQGSSTIEQCGTYTINSLSDVPQPVRVQGIIPVGSSFTLTPPEDSPSYNWTVNVASGTRILFFMTDNEGNLSSVSSIQQVASSSNSSCINDDSPRSTLSSATQEPTSTSPGGSQPSSVNTGSSHKSNGAIIGGAVGGAVAFLLIVAAIVLYIWKRKRLDPMIKYSRKRERHGLDGMRALDLAPSTPNLSNENRPRLPPMDFAPEPFLLAPPANNSSSGGGSRSNTNEPAIPMSPRSYSSRSQGLGSNDRGPPPVARIGQNTRSPSQNTAASTKAAMAGTSQGLAPPQRFVLHTDAGSIDNINTNALELPPTYNTVNSNPQTIAPSSDSGSGAVVGSDNGENVNNRTPDGRPDLHSHTEGPTTPLERPPPAPHT